MKRVRPAKEMKEVLVTEVVPVDSSEKKGLFETLFSYPYRCNDNQNFLKMSLIHLLELTLLLTNVVAPFIVSDLARENNEQGSSSEGINWNAYAPLIIAAGALLITTILPKIRNLAINSVRFNTQKNMVLDMTRGVYDRDYDKNVGTPTGEYFAALTNNYHSVDRVMSTIVSDLAPVTLETVGISAVLGYRYHWVLGVIPAATLAVYLAVAFVAEKMSTDLKIGNKKAMGEVYGGLVEGTNNYQIAHQYGNTEFELGKLNKTLTKLEDSYNDVYGAQEKSGLALSVIVRLGFVGAMAYAFFVPPSSTFWSQDFVLFAYYLFRFSSITEPLPPKISELYKGYIDAHGVLEFLTKESSVPNPQKPVRLTLDAPPSIEFKGVNFSYNKESAGLSNISFSVQPGQKLVIMGPTGSGKSTLLKLMQRFFNFEGEILIDGVNIKKVNKDELRSCLSVVSQEVGLINDTIYRNIKYGDLNATQDDVAEAAKFAGLKFDRERFFSEAQKGGQNFSGGEKQRVTIARALLKPNSYIFLLDEPTSALDQTTAKEVMGMLDHLTKYGTTFLVTHDPQAAVNADLIVYIDQGQVLEQGTFQELMQKKGGFYQQVLVQCQKMGVNVEDINVEQRKAEALDMKDFYLWRKKRRNDPNRIDLDSDDHLGTEAEPLLVVQ